MRIKITTQDFIAKATSIHNNRYDYSLANYITRSTKLTIVCLLHGQFEQQPHNHLAGQGCPKCKIVSISAKLIKTTEWFITEAQKLFGSCYDYSKTIYTKSSAKLTITCPTHGDFEQTANSHLAKHGCSKCAFEINTSIRSKSLNTFIQEAATKHNNRYSYELVKYKTAHIPVLITCPEHGQFSQSPNNHIKGKGCPKCNKSKGELVVKTWLITNNIVFEEEKTFIKCINPTTGWKLKFDFYIPNKNLLIEFQGIQHYQPVDFANKGKTWAITQFNKNIKLDKLKVKYCKNNKIKLLTIPYTKLNDIGTILQPILQ